MVRKPQKKNIGTLKGLGLHPAIPKLLNVKKTLEKEHRKTKGFRLTPRNA